MPIILEESQYENSILIRFKTSFESNIVTVYVNMNFRIVKEHCETYTG